jgi:hypothetical protein
MQKGNRDIIEGKMNEHFIKIRRVIDIFEAKMQQKLDSLTDEQTQRLS